LLWIFKKDRNKQWHNSASFSKAKASYRFYCDLHTTDLFPEFRVDKEPDLNRLHGFFTSCVATWTGSTTWLKTTRAEGL